MAVQVIDDYLSNSEWTYLSDTMMGAGGDFPWKYSPNKVRGGDDDHQFTHQFYSIGRKSDWFGLVAPLMKRFHVLGVYRIKSNLEPNCETLLSDVLSLNLLLSVLYGSCIL